MLAVPLFWDGEGDDDVRKMSDNFSSQADGARRFDDFAHQEPSSDVSEHEE